jgi:8-oxo-dGTP diphosphatase
LQQLHTFGTPGRDPRGWTITVAYLARVDPEEASAWAPHAGTDATEVAWFDVDDLPSLAFDHAEILACARQAMDSGGPDA